MVRAASIAIALTAAGGCVQRTIHITSEPPGALVWLNDREIGRTPVDADFTYYGTYDVRLVREGCEPLLTSGDAVPPLWDNVGLDLVAEILPLDFRADVRWHYVLERTETRPEVLEAELIERGRALRDRLEDDRER